LKKPDSPAPAGRITLRQIARAAKVSPMAVSYALRDRPEVSPAERVRIRALAEKIGYRPDPLLTHLMQHLRTHRRIKSSANLAVLTGLDAPFVRRLIDGANTRAEKLGYHLDRVDVKPHLHNARSLTRTLEARGVAGVLLAPATDPASYSGLLDWSRFAAVAMTYSLVEPHVHRVVTHHFDNAIKALGLLRQQGFRRIGLAMTSDMEFRANHSYSAAYYRMAGMAGERPLPLLLFDIHSPREIRQWFAAHKPEAVLAANAHQATRLIAPHLSARVRARTAFVCLDHEATHRVSGIDQLFETIGSHALDALVAQLHRNERGLPEKPTVTMVEGQWLDTCGFHPFAPLR
jgi:DNA-binding LacI/PurR family transcriptional regulator